MRGTYKRIYTQKKDFFLIKKYLNTYIYTVQTLEETVVQDSLSVYWRRMFGHKALRPHWRSLLHWLVRQDDQFSGPTFVTRFYSFNFNSYCLEPLIICFKKISSFTTKSLPLIMHPLYLKIHKKIKKVTINFTLRWCRRLLVIGEKMISVKVFQFNYCEIFLCL